MTITPDEHASGPDGQLQVAGWDDPSAGRQGPLDGLGTAEIKNSAPEFIPWTEGFDDWSTQVATSLESYRAFSIMGSKTKGQPKGHDRLEISVTHLGPMVEFRLQGEVDVSTSPFLRDTVNQQIALDGNPLIVLDLSAMSFIDSTGLGVLVAACRRARAVGSDLVLQHPRPNVAKVFAITGLDRIFTIADDPD